VFWWHFGRFKRFRLTVDKPGYGKTVTMLALIHANPLVSFTDLRMSELDKRIRLPSRATIIICPSNLVAQWKSEVFKCMGNNTSCIVISGIRDHRRLNWSDIMFADVVIVSLAFLTNSNYNTFLSTKFCKPALTCVKTAQLKELWSNYFANPMHKIIQAGHQAFGDKTGINIECFYFHRVVFDEFHELESKHRIAKEIASQLKGNSHWGITGIYCSLSPLGTPKISTVDDIVSASSYLNCSFNGTVAQALTFNDKFIRRNKLEIELPPLINETIWIDLTPTEKALYLTWGSRSEHEAFMLCSGFQVSDLIAEVTGDKKVLVV
jgi:hypothetical protein